MAFFEPLRCLFGFKREIMFTGTHLYLDTFYFRNVGLSFYRFLLLVFGVLVPAIIHYFCNGRRGIGRNFDEVKTKLLGLFKSFG